MKIFLIGSFDEEHLTAWSVYRPLVELGHDVLIYDYRINFFHDIKENAFVNFLLLIDKFNPDLILILKGELFNVRMLTAINNYKVALWHFDFDYHAKFQIEKQVPHIDYLFTICRPWHEIYISKRRSNWLPQGNDPIMFFPVEPNQEELDDIAFIGTLKPKKECFVRKFIDAGMKVSVYGENWQYSTLKNIWKGPAYCKRFSQAVANSKIIISTIDGSGLKFDSTTSQRIFRVCGCKGVYLTDHVDGINDFYKEDEEIFTYKTHDEAVEKAKELLKNPVKREAAALKSYERTLEEHLYIHRVRRLLECVS